MKLHIAKNQLDIANPIIIQHIVTIANFSQIPRDSLHTYLSISTLLELLNSHIFASFHINLMRRDNNKWLVESDAYRVEDKELVDALWRSVQYAYDEEKRKAEIEEREKVWRKNDNELVHVKDSSRGL